LEAEPQIERLWGSRKGLRGRQTDFITVLRERERDFVTVPPPLGDPAYRQEITARRTRAARQHQQANQATKQWPSA
jgi:hypothetical protein